MRRFKARRAVMAMAAVSLLAASCGGGNGSGDASDEADATDGGEEANVVEDSEDGDLVINGEVIATADVWAAAQEEDAILAYLATPEGTLSRINEHFIEDTGIEIEHVRLPGARLYERIMTEFSADQLEADIVDATDLALAQEMLDAGVYEPYFTPGWDEFPDDYKDADGHWYNHVVSMMSIVYNEPLIDDLLEGDTIESWEDLLDERLRGQVGMTPATIGGSAYSTVYFQRQEFGREYWEELADYDPTFRSSIVSLTEEVARGEIAVAITSVAQGVDAIREGAPLAIAWPDEGIPAAPIFLGVTGQGSSPNAAKVYLGWLTSAAGGQAISEIYHAFSPNPAAPLPEGLPSEDLIYSEAFHDPTFLELRDEWISDWESVMDYEEPEDD